jgi:hypothetical protein
MSSTTHDNTAVLGDPGTGNLAPVQIDRSALARLKAALAKHPDAGSQHEAITAAVNQLAEGLEALAPQAPLWERARDARAKAKS